jgi:hypothetical protein
MSAEADKRQAEADKRQAEWNKQFAESKAEADKRQAEYEKQFAESKAEADKRQAEADKRQAKWNKQFADSKAEADKSMEELRRAQKETDLQIKRMSKEIGGIGDFNGYVAEDNIYYSLEDSMVFAGIKFDEMERRVQVRPEPFAKTETELDVLLRNGEALAIIEVKHRVKKKDVRELLYDKLGKIKKYYPKHKDYKILLGIGGMTIENDAEIEAKKNGIGIIRVIGNTVEYHTENIIKY